MGSCEAHQVHKGLSHLDLDEKLMDEALADKWGLLSVTKSKKGVKFLLMVCYLSPWITKPNTLEMLGNGSIMRIYIRVNA